MTHVRLRDPGAPNAPYRGTACGAQVRALLARAARGERGAMTDSGRLIVTDTRAPGRAAIDGMGVALGRVHAALARHPALTVVEVIAGDDGFGGERLGARVQSANRALDEAALRTWCTGHLDAAERPSDLTLARTNGADR